MPTRFWIIVVLSLLAGPKTQVIRAVARSDQAAATAAVT